MTVGRGGSHDVLLESSDDASPTTAVSLMLATDESGRKRWVEGRLPPFPVRQSEGAVQYSHLDPNRNLVFSQKTWHGGALHPVFRTDGSTENKYLEADGMDMRAEGVATLGMLKSQRLALVMRNSGGEEGVVGNYTEEPSNGQASMTAVTSFTDDSITRSPKEGKYALRVYYPGGSSEDEFWYVTIPWLTAYQGRSVTLAGWGWRETGSNEPTLKLRIRDSAGSTDSGSASTSAWTWLSATRTIDAAATKLEVGLWTQVTNSSTTGSVYADGLALFFSSADSCVGLAEAVGKLYAAIGPFICRWDETNDYWEIVYVHPSGTSATDIISHGDRIYVAYGYNASYVYGVATDVVNKTATTIAFNEVGVTGDTITDSGNGFITAGFKAGDSIVVTGSTSNNGTYTIKTVVAGTITVSDEDDLVAEAAGASVTIKAGFVASSQTDPADKARYFAIRRNQIWKSETANTVAAAVDPTNATRTTGADDTWTQGGSPFTVGSPSTDITKLYGFRDSIVPGKEDGLHFYVLTRFSSSQSAATINQEDFVNVTNQFSTLIDADNFSRGAEWWGRLFLIAAQQSLFYFDGQTLVDMSSLLFAPRTGHTGRVRAITGDPSNLFLLVDTNQADATDEKETWLYSLRERRGEWFVHTLQKVPLSDINAIAVHNGYLYAFGRLYVTGLTNYHMVAYRWTLPSKSIAPAFDATPSLNLVGSFKTYHWDGGLADVEKACVALTIFTKAQTLDAEHPIRVYYKPDGKAKEIKARTIAFNNANPDTITDSGNGFLTAGFEADDSIRVTDSTTNNGTYTISSVTAGTITLVAADALTAETAGAIVKIQGNLLGTYTGTGSIQTKFFDSLTDPESNAVCRSVQLEFEMGTDDTISPELYAFALHTTLRPERVKTWALWVEIGGGVVMRNGLADPVDKATTLAALSTLENQVYPIEFTEDFDEDGTTTAHRAQIVPGTLTRASVDDAELGAETYYLMVQEVTLA